MEITFFGGGWLLAQVALFIVYYGFGKTLPWWVLWFPTLIIGSIIAFVIVIILIIFLGGLFIGDYW